MIYKKDLLEKIKELESSVEKLEYSLMCAELACNHEYVQYHLLQELLSTNVAEVAGLRVYPQK